MKLLFLAVFLRSLIAPGLTVDTSDDSPFGVTLAFCGVLDSINEGEDQSSHGHDHSHDHPASSGQDRDVEHGLLESHCGVLLVGVTFVSEKHADYSSLYVLEGSHQFSTEYELVYFRNQLFQRPQSRAPPFSFLI